MRLASLGLAGMLAAFGAAAEACEGEQAKLGVGVKQASCTPWGRVPVQRDEYWALNFEFDLTADLQTGRAVNSLKSFGRFFRAKDIALVVSVAAEVGGVALPKQTLLAYDLTKNGTNAVSKMTPEFFTPYVIADGTQMKFTVTLEQASAPSLRLVGIAEAVVKPLGLGTPDKLILSKASAEVVEAASGIADQVVQGLFADSNLGEATLVMGHAQRSGAARRVLELVIEQDGEEFPIGKLTVSVVVKPSLASAFNWTQGVDTAAAEQPKASDADRLLGLLLPARLGEGQSLLSALRGEDDTFTHINRLLGASPGDSIRGDACKRLRTALEDEYGFTSDDAIRAVAALLRRDGPTEPLYVDNDICFKKWEWPRITERGLFEPQTKPSDWPVFEKHAEYLARGMREGFDAELERALSDTVEIELPRELKEEIGCGGFVPKSGAMACLTRIGLNRHDRPAPHKTIDGWAEFHFSRRRDVEQSLAKLLSERLPTDLSATEAALADPENVKHISETLDQFYQAEIEAAGTPMKIKRIRIVPLSKREIGEHLSGIEIRQLAVSCWAPGNDRGGSAFCAEKKRNIKPSILTSS